jgi:hypothetical protein
MRNDVLRRLAWRVSLAALLVVAEAGAAGATDSMATARYGHKATGLADGTVLVVGGFGVSEYPANVEIYDPATDTFSPTGSLATARNSHTATGLDDGTVLVVGGFNQTTGALASAEIYDPATGTWR